MVTVLLPVMITFTTIVQPMSLLEPAALHSLHKFVTKTELKTTFSIGNATLSNELPQTLTKVLVISAFKTNLRSFHLSPCLPDDFYSPASQLSANL